MENTYTQSVSVFIPLQTRTVSCYEVQRHCHPEEAASLTVIWFCLKLQCNVITVSVLLILLSVAQKEKSVHGMSAVASPAMGHVPPLTSKSERQLSKYCEVCEISWCRCQQLTALSISNTLVTKLLVIEQLLHPVPVHRECPMTYFQCLRLLATNPGDATECLRLVCWHSGVQAGLDHCHKVHRLRQWAAASLCLLVSFLLVDVSDYVASDQMQMVNVQIRIRSHAA